MGCAMVKRVKDPNWQALEAFRTRMASDPLWMSSLSEESSSETSEHEECEGHRYGDYEVVVSPIVKVAMNLACIKQRLKKLPSLSEHQKRVMCEVTEEQIDST